MNKEPPNYRETQCCFNCEHSCGKDSVTLPLYCNKYGLEVKENDICDSWEIILTQRVPFSMFGITKLVPLNVYRNGLKVDSEDYEKTLWVERGEDWYSFGSPEFHNKNVLVVERGDWLKSRVMSANDAGPQDGD